MGDGMSAWKTKRFWNEATARPIGDGWGVWLDARQVRTPAKAALIVPTEALAQGIAAEWQAQEGAIDPLKMPLTRAANAAIDKVAPQFEEVAGLIAAYGGSDLLCYRAEEPEALVARQAAGWDPLLGWSSDRFAAPLTQVRGVVPVEQPAESLASLSREVMAMTPFELTALHEFASITGSLVLGLAIHHGRLSPDEAWALSRIDEDWQAELWGADDEATELANRRAGDLMAANRFLGLISPRC